MNRPVCCCSETCPVHCLVPFPAAEPRSEQSGGLGPGTQGGRGLGGLRPDPSFAAPGGHPPGGNLVQHARSGHTLVTRGEGGDIGVLDGGQAAPCFAYFNPLYIWNEKRNKYLCP